MPDVVSSAFLNYISMPLIYFQNVFNLLLIITKFNLVIRRLQTRNYDCQTRDYIFQARNYEFAIATFKLVIKYSNS